MIQCRRYDGTIITHPNYETCSECVVPLAGDKVDAFTGRYLSAHMGRCTACDASRRLEVRAVGWMSEITVCSTCSIVVSQEQL